MCIYIYIHTYVYKCISYIYIYIYIFIYRREHVGHPSRWEAGPAPRRSIGRGAFPLARDTVTIQYNNNTILHTGAIQW